MKVIVCGAGKVGLSIVTYLEKYNNDVIVIDQDPNLVRQISERHDVRSICGFASHPDILSKAGANEADMLIAVTHIDEVNMVTCEVAHALFKVPMKIARIRNQAYLKPRWVKMFKDANLSIDVTISPEVEVAQAISRSLAVPGAFRIIPFVDDLISVIGVKCLAETPIVNTPLKHIASLFPDVTLRPLYLFREDTHFIPEENERLNAGDELFFATATTDIETAMRAFGEHGRQKRKVLILGGGSVGMTLAQNIENYHPMMRASLIEFSKERAEEISQDLSDTVVINGDALEQDILLEAGVANTETVVAVTEDDKVNTLASLLAKQNGAKWALALINNQASAHLVTTLGVDSVINPRAITVSSILRHVRRGHICAVHTLREGVGELLDIEIHENARIIGLTVEDVEVPGEIIIGALVRKGEVLIPKPNTKIQLEDRVVVMGISTSIEKLENLFSARLDYF